MITKILQSWYLFKASIAVTFQHPKLLLFPFVTAILTGIVALFFITAMAVPLVLAHTHHSSQTQQAVVAKDATVQTERDANGGNGGWGNWFVARPGFPFGWFVGLPIYFVSMFLGTFFNVAFYNEIISALNGRGVSLRRGLGVARDRLPAILAWSVLAGLVGWLIRMIEERLPLAARIVTGLVGMAWSIAAVFAIPVIIQEQTQRNPLKILQHSAMTLKRAWGEGLIGYIGFSAAGAIIFGCSLLPLAAAGLIAFLLKSVWIIVIAGAFWVLGLCLIGYVSGVAGHVYRCALYLYAAEGVVPGAYSRDLLDMAWRVKKI
jgi:hypothetical protein